MDNPPTIHTRVLTTIMTHYCQPFTVMAVLREVNASIWEPLGVVQVKKALDRMADAGHLTRRALGVFEWKK